MVDGCYQFSDVYLELDADDEKVDEVGQTTRASGGANIAGRLSKLPFVSAARHRLSPATSSGSWSPNETASTGQDEADHGRRRATGGEAGWVKRVMRRSKLEDDGGDGKAKEKPNHRHSIGDSLTGTLSRLFAKIPTPRLSAFTGPGQSVDDSEGRDDRTPPARQAAVCRRISKVPAAGDAEFDDGCWSDSEFDEEPLDDAVYSNADEQQPTTTTINGRNNNIIIDEDVYSNEDQFSASDPQPDQPRHHAAARIDTRRPPDAEPTLIDFSVYGTCTAAATDDDEYGNAGEMASSETPTAGKPPTGRRPGVAALPATIGGDVGNHLPSGRRPTLVKSSSATRFEEHETTGDDLPPACDESTLNPGNVESLRAKLFGKLAQDIPQRGVNGFGETRSAPCSPVLQRKKRAAPAPPKMDAYPGPMPNLSRTFGPDAAASSPTNRSPPFHPPTAGSPDVVFESSPPLPARRPSDSGEGDKGRAGASSRALKPLPPMPSAGASSPLPVRKMIKSHNPDNYPDVRAHPPQPVATNQQTHHAEFDTTREITAYPWYFGSTSREECETLLQSMVRDGSFVVRDSVRGGSTNPYALCVMHDGCAYNLLIRRKPNMKYALGTEKPDEPEFNNVAELVAYHYRHAIYLSSGRGLSPGDVILTICPPANHRFRR